MNNLIKTKLLLAVLLIGILFSNAQVKTKIFDQEVPNHLKPFRDIAISEYFVANPKDFEISMHSKEQNPSDFSNKFGIAVPVQIDI